MYAVRSIHYKQGIYLEYVYNVLILGRYIHFFMLFLMLLLCDWQVFVELTAPMRQSTLWTLALGQTHMMKQSLSFW